MALVLGNTDQDAGTSALNKQANMESSESFKVNLSFPLTIVWSLTSLLRGMGDDGVYRGKAHQTLMKSS